MIFSGCLFRKENQKLRCSFYPFLALEFEKGVFVKQEKGLKI